MKELTFHPLPYQDEVLWDVTTPIIGVAAGKGSGKSFIIAVCKAIYLSCIHRGYEGLVASPTYGMTRRNLIPMFKRVNDELDLGIKGLNSSAPGQLMIDWGDRTSIIHLDVSIENHSRLNGMNLAWLIADECDIARLEDMQDFANEAVFRCRFPAPGQITQICFMGAPELNGWMGEYFGDELTPEKRIHHWSMNDNYLLSKEYKDRVKSLIPLARQEAWVEGRFSYNTDGLVYDCFDPKLNGTILTLADLQRDEQVWVSFDVNMGGCSTVIGIKRGAHFFVLDEWMAMRDAEAIIERVKRQSWAYQAILTCDPATTQLLPYFERSGLKFNIMKAAPEIEHRITAVNLRFGTESMLNGNITRHLLINQAKCKVLTKATSRQSFVKGIPDKKTRLEDAKTDISGPVDALGYLIYLLWPYNPRGPIQQPRLRS